MIINGVTDYWKDGREMKTLLVASRATTDGELRSTQSGKYYGTVSTRAYSRKDGTAAFLTVKCWGGSGARTVANLRKGDSFLAAGQIESREYNGKTYTDLVADFVMSGGPSVSEPHGSYPAKAPVNVKADDFSELEEDLGELPF